MKKVLIVSCHFPPMNRISSRRYGVMCKYFETYGYESYVITANHDRISNGVCSNLELPIEKKRIIRIGTLRNNEITNVLWNLILKLMEFCKIESRTLTKESIGWYEKVKRNVKLDSIGDIDLIIGTYPPMENLYVMKYLSRKFKCPYIVDVRDLISDYTETAIGYKKAKWLDKKLEKYILRRANGIVTVTPGFRDILKKRFPDKRFKVVFNGWDRKSSVEVREKAKDKYLYYAGSLYLHRLESFELLVKSLKRINRESDEKFRFIVRSIGPEDLDAKAHKIVRNEKMQQYISILRAASEEVVREEQEKAYINVVLSTIHEDDKALMTTIPGKVYELLNEMPSILAVVPKKSDIDRVLYYTRKGIASISEEEIIDFILKENKNYRGNEKIKYFTRQKQAERLCRFMDKVLSDT